MNYAVTKIANRTKLQNAPRKSARPLLLLTINNGAGHTRAAEAIAEAWRNLSENNVARVAEVSDFMSPLARLTHVTAYLWLVKNAPRIWEKIDAYQKRRTQTSPDWFYRRQCRKLFDLARGIQPAAIVATEVGCCEIAALIKRDLRLKIPLVAVNVNYDADRAWIQPEVNLFCLANEAIAENFVALGANPEKTVALGVPMQPEFTVPDESEKKAARRAVAEWLGLETNKPLIVIAGGSEGMGKIEEITKNLLASNLSAVFIVLTGNNDKLKQKCEKLEKEFAAAGQLRVLGWTNRLPQIYRAADLLISKLGNTFDEATACALPIIAPPPPPGAEWAQYDLLEKWNLGRAVKTIAELKKTVTNLLENPEEIENMRRAAQSKIKINAAKQIAARLEKQILVANKVYLSNNKTAREKLNCCEAAR